MPAKLSAKQYAIALHEATRGRAAAELEAPMKRFVEILAAHRRLSLAPSVIKEFERYALAQEGKIQGEVVTARPLSDGVGRALSAALSKRFGRDVLLTPLTDPSVIGGVRVRVGDTLIDGTVATQLADLKKRFLTE